MNKDEKRNSKPQDDKKWFAIVFNELYIVFVFSHVQIMQYKLYSIYYENVNFIVLCSDIAEDYCNGRRFK